MISKIPLLLTMALLSVRLAAPGLAQQVCIPLPRLLTMMPMGGQVGTSVEVTISGEYLEDVSELLFSTPKITAKPILGPDGKVVENKFLVMIPADAPIGVHDARVMSRLGISSARAFTIGTLPEIVRTKPNTSLETALALPINSVCNGVMTNRAVDYFSFQGINGQRIAVDCAAAGIDSKLNPVVIIADGKGRDLLVNRTGGALDFTPTADGTYVIKLQSLTFQGGPQQFYRLAIQQVSGTGPVPRQAATARVSSFSWLPVGAPVAPALAEIEPNNQSAQAQKISLPCDIGGNFFPAADVDTFEFTAKKDEVWWVEVGSERLGLPTDPFVLVQRVAKEGEKEILTDVAELYDIPSPMKVTINGYSYDGPPYNAGSPDVLGKMEIKEDGIYRLQVRDLFGGTRHDPGNHYRLIVRQATPDFSLVAWAVHMELRNGDRSALSKPIALRGGAGMAFEVVVVRRDGFDGDIELGMEDLPAGVSASGLKIPAGKVQGMMIINAAENAPRSFGVAKMFGKAQINGVTVTRPCRLASMEWPVKDASSEKIPSPRLVADVPVSVTDAEQTPLSIVSAENKVWESKVGETLKIPLKVTWHSEFTGSSLKMKTYGAGFEGVKEFDIPLNAATAEAVIDLATLKTPPGEFTIAFYGSAVVHYRHNPASIKGAEESQKKAEQDVAAQSAEAKKLSDEAVAAPPDKKADADNAAKLAIEKQKQAEATLAEAGKRLKTATDAAAPVDMAEIFVSEPIRLAIKAAEVANTTPSAPAK